MPKRAKSVSKFTQLDTTTTWQHKMTPPRGTRTSPKIKTPAALRSINLGLDTRIRRVAAKSQLLFTMLFWNTALKVMEAMTNF